MWRKRRLGVTQEVDRPQKIFDQDNFWSHSHSGKSNRRIVFFVSPEAVIMLLEQLHLSGPRIVDCWIKLPSLSRWRSSAEFLSQ